MKIEELKGIYEQPETEHYFLEKPREKTGEIQATCLSYEAMHDISAMLQERGNPEEGYLFVSTTKGKGDQLEVRTIHKAMKGLAEKSFGTEKAKEFKTKPLRSFYNSALLRADIKSEVKDLMMGHARQSARRHYDYDEITIKEAYQRAFEYLSINGLQVRADLKKVMEALRSLRDANMVFQSQLEAKDKELESVKSELRTLGKLVKQISDSDHYRELAEGVLEEMAEKLAKDPEFAEKFRKDAEKIKSGYFKGKR